MKEGKRAIIRDNEQLQRCSSAGETNIFVSIVCTSKSSGPRLITGMTLNLMWSSDLDSLSPVVACVFLLYCCGVLWVTTQYHRYRSNPNA